MTTFNLLSIPCPACGHENDTQARFCEQCSIPLRVDVAAGIDFDELTERDLQRLIVEGYSLVYAAVIRGVISTQSSIASARVELSNIEAIAARAAANFSRRLDNDVIPEILGGK